MDYHKATKIRLVKNMKCYVENIARWIKIISTVIPIWFKM